MGKTALANACPWPAMPYLLLAPQTPTPGCAAQAASSGPPTWPFLSTSHQSKRMHGHTGLQLCAGHAQDRLPGTLLTRAGLSRVLTTEIKQSSHPQRLPCQWGQYQHTYAQTHTPTHERDGGQVLWTKTKHLGRSHWRAFSLP